MLGVKNRLHDRMWKKKLPDETDKKNSVTA